MKKKLFLISIFYLFLTTIFAQKYDNYTEQGLISYYTEKFEGRLTASNEIFNNKELVGSHKKLPFGTKVLVTNLSNNKEVTIKIIDRGPYAYGRIMDISEEAAKQIGLIETGTTKASIKVISLGKKEMPKVEIDRNYLKGKKNNEEEKYIVGKFYSTWGTEMFPKGYGIQLGTMQNAEACIKYCKKIVEDTKKAEKVFMLVYKNDAGDTVYKVLLGEYEDEKSAKNAVKKYTSVIGTQVMVKRY